MFGNLYINVLRKTGVEGDSVNLDHGLEVTIQKLWTLLTADDVFLHTMLGLSNDYRHGKCAAAAAVAPAGHRAFPPNTAINVFVFASC